jgi:hypothetical protein
MFHPTIGFLSLSWVNVANCLNDYHPGKPSVSQLFALLSKSFCPAEGFTASFQGQFVVSRKRILRQTLDTYRYLLVSYVLDAAYASQTLVHGQQGSVEFMSTAMNLVARQVAM